MKTAYLQQVIAIGGHIFQINAYLRSDMHVVSSHFYDGLETRIFHCKNLYIMRIITYCGANIEVFTVKHDAFGMQKTHDKTR